MATPLSVLKAGGTPVFVDCNREDLCMSFEDFERKAEEHKPKAAWLVHIGGHIAFDVERIADYCRANDIFLVEDCAHAHGATWNGRRPGPGARRASTRFTPRRRSRPARAASWSPETTTSSPSPVTTATTASRTTTSRGLASG